ncbi:MAG: EscU/YscU/HrcU family type III secretion system export apparatus switch protein [Rivihabitans pingtungensis]
MARLQFYDKPSAEPRTPCPKKAISKTEEPSEQKLRQAREDGQVPRSRELATFAVTMTGVGLLVVLGNRIVDSINTIIRREFTFDQKTLLQEGLINEHFRQGMFDMLLVLAPILGALMVAAIGPSLLLVAGILR